MPTLPIPEDLILSKLGKNGWGRWQYFRKCFSGGWDERGQKPLSPRSQEVFFTALASLDLPDHAKPSLFLTDGGNLELAWRDVQGRAVQIEFGPAESEIYVEASEYEATVPNRELAEVIRQRLNA